MSAHDDAFAESALDSHFEQFGDAVRYRPVDGEWRSITAIVSMRARLNEDDHGNEEALEYANVVCRRSATLGIDDPQLGDELLLPIALDADQRLWMYQGIRENETEHDWKLVFGRELVTSRGGM